MYKRLGISITSISLFAMAACVNAGTALQKTEVMEFFNKYESLNAEFDASVIDMYGDGATLLGKTIASDGSTEEVSMGIGQYREMFPRILDTVKKIDERSEYSDVAVELLSEHSAKITANRFSTYKCYNDGDYYMIVSTNSENELKITEEYQVSPKTSLCEGGANKQLAAILEATAESIKPHLPVMIDADTQLYGLSVNGTTLRYEYMFPTTTKDEAIDNFVEVMRPIMIEQTCAMPSIAPLLERGAAMEFDFISSDSHHLGTFSMKGSDCIS